MQAARGASLNPGDPDRKPTSRRPLLLFAATATVAYLLDLVTKTLAMDRLQGRPPVKVVGDLLQLNLVRNPGAAFSTGTSYTLLLSLVAIAAVGFVLFTARRLTSLLWAFGLGCLLGGVLGNLTDRVFRDPGFLRGHVVDFLELPNWPVFNVADICINVAAAVIVIQAIRGVSHSDRRHDAEKAPSDAGSPAS
jgi:signal peptidase II